MTKTTTKLLFDAKCQTCGAAVLLDLERGEVSDGCEWQEPITALPTSNGEIKVMTILCPSCLAVENRVRKEVPEVRFDVIARMVRDYEKDDTSFGCLGLEPWDFVAVYRATMFVVDAERAANRDRHREGRSPPGATPIPPNR